MIILDDFEAHQSDIGFLYRRFHWIEDQGWGMSRSVNEKDELIKRLYTLGFLEWHRQTVPFLLHRFHSIRDVMYEASISLRWMDHWLRCEGRLLTVPRRKISTKYCAPSLLIPFELTSSDSNVCGGRQVDFSVNRDRYSPYFLVEHRLDSVLLHCWLSLLKVPM